MASRLRPLGLLTVWIGVPIGLYAAGYYFVGPRIDSHVPAKFKQQVGDQFTMLNKQVHKIVTPIAQQPKPTPPLAPQSEATTAASPDGPAPAKSDAPPLTSPTQADEGGPQVEVSVHGTGPTRRAVRTRPHARRRLRRRHPLRLTPKPKPAATDEGSYGGTQDQGTTTGGTTDPPAGG
ncbi:MAG: hypothetical protein ACYC96_14430 [Fimbriimonadaceae bacterium]